MQFIEHRVAVKRIVRLIRKWLSAGVLEDGKRTQSEVGTVQGGSISPLLANIYLHYAFDLWVQRWDRSRLAVMSSWCVSLMILSRSNREKRGERGAPGSFKFLGFTHSCGKTRKGGFTVLRHTMRKRWQAKLKAVKAQLKARLHDPSPRLANNCGRSCSVACVTTASR